METGNRLMIGAMVVLAAFFGYLAFYLAAHHFDGSAAFLTLAGYCIGALSPSVLKMHQPGLIGSTVSTDSVETVNVQTTDQTTDKTNG